MAAPRVFVSSTYYDLRQTRDNIKSFIENLGYEAVMHEHSGVTYTQNGELEYDCYRELSSCEIFVSIIGSSFGSKSNDNELSITMNEIKTAIKNKKKIYIFIANNIYIENNTYIQNKGNSDFKSAYTDNLKIHQFIEELKELNHTNVIIPFETTDQIIGALKAQFAGLLQNFLTQESSMTEAKTAYDLQETVDQFKSMIEAEREEKEEFLKNFQGTIFANNLLTQRIKQKIGMHKSSFYVNDLDALDEFMNIVGYSSVDVDDISEYKRKYKKTDDRFCYIMTLKNELFNDDGSFKDIRKYSIVDDLLDFQETIVVEEDDDLPF